jgi:hypothetical protein
VEKAQRTGYPFAGYDELLRRYPSIIASAAKQSTSPPAALALWIASLRSQDVDEPQRIECLACTRYDKPLCNFATSKHAEPSSPEGVILVSDIVFAAI